MCVSLIVVSSKEFSSGSAVFDYGTEKREIRNYDDVQYVRLAYRTYTSYFQFVYYTSVKIFEMTNYLGD